MEDREIIELYFRRDERAIRETDRKYGRLCLSLSHNILASGEDARECVSDATSLCGDASHRKGRRTSWPILPRSCGTCP